MVHYMKMFLSSGKRMKGQSELGDVTASVYNGLPDQEERQKWPHSQVLMENSTT